MGGYETLTACRSAVPLLLLCLQDDLRKCRYSSVHVFDHFRDYNTSKQLKVEVDNKRISGGFYPAHQSVQAGMVADQLRVADGDDPLNFPGELLEQVGCFFDWRVCVCVGVSHYAESDTTG
jgi:hypothetical protein